MRARGGASQGSLDGGQRREHLSGTVARGLWGQESVELHGGLPGGLQSPAASWCAPRPTCPAGLSQLLMLEVERNRVHNGNLSPVAFQPVLLEAGPKLSADHRPTSAGQPPCR